MSTFAATRQDLQRVATHIVARRRHDVTGRFGLRATPGGIGTPAFGPVDALEVVRTSGLHLLHEVGGAVRSRSMAGATLSELAAFVGVDLEAPFTVGGDTPDVGDPAAVLAMDGLVVAELADWYSLGWRALDHVVAHADRPDTVQLWPEHFDVGTVVAVGPSPNDRVNLGASPGDHHHDEPYLYVQPWTDARPGGQSYWNISFGAVLSGGSVRSVDEAASFLREGIDRLAR